jgi:hypothetical protein
MVLVWHGESETAANTTAMQDLARLERQLAEHDARLPDDGSVRLAFACTEIDDAAADSTAGERLRLRDLVGQVLASSTEWPLARRDAFSVRTDGASGGS